MVENLFFAFMFILYQIFYGNHPTYCTENKYYDTELCKKRGKFVKVYETSTPSQRLIMLKV